MSRPLRQIAQEVQNLIDENIGLLPVSKKALTNRLSKLGNNPSSKDWMIRELKTKLINIRESKAQIKTSGAFKVYKVRQTQFEVQVARFNPSAGAGGFGTFVGFVNEPNTRVFIIPKWKADEFPVGFELQGEDRINDFLAVLKLCAPLALNSALTDIENFQSSTNIRLTVVGKTDLTDAMSKRYNKSPADKLLRDGSVVGMTHPWVVNAYADGLFQHGTYHYENGCMTSAVMNTWADKHNAKNKTKAPANFDPKNRKKTEPRHAMTPEIIHRLVFPRKRWNGHAQPMTFNQLKPVFEYFGVEGRLYNVKKGLQASYTPKTKNDHLKKVMSILSHMEHAFLVDTQAIQHQISDEHSTLTASNKYGVGSTPKPYIQSVKTIKEALDRGEEGDYLYVGDEKSLLNQLQTEMPNYLPQVQLSTKGLISKLIFCINGTVIGIQTPDFGAYAMTPLATLNDDAIHNTRVLQAQVRSPFPHLISTYGEEFRQTLIDFRACPGHFRFGDEGVYPSIDQSFCYTNIMKDFEAFPVFNESDVFVKYDGHKLEPYNLYIVETRVQSKMQKVIYPTKRCMKYGRYITDRHPSLRITHFSRPSVLEKPDFKTLIEEIFSHMKKDEKDNNDPGLPRDVVKMIFNSSWGMLGKQGNQYVRASLFKTREEALEFAPCALPPKEGNEFWTVFETSPKVDLVNGCLPIQHMIYDECRKRVADIVRLDEANAMGIHTDCVFFKKLPECPAHCKVEEPKMRTCEKYEFNDGREFYAPYKPTAKVITFPDERKLNVAHDAFDEHDRIFIKSKYPGAGKTELWKSYAEETDYLVIYPTREQASAYPKHGKTVWALCAKHPMLDNIKASPLTASLVIFEELGQYSLREQGFIREYMNKHPNTKFIATGDVKQIDPVQPSWNPLRDRNAQFDYWTTSLFTVHIELTEIKRQTDTKKIYEMYDDLWVKNMNLTTFVEKHCIPMKLEDIPQGYSDNVASGTSSFRNVCYLNKTKDILEARSLTAMTGHKMQGQSYDEPVVIHDIGFYYLNRNWLWVSATRCRDPSLIFYCSRSTA